MDRNTLEVWTEPGSTTLGGRAQEKVREILTTHVPKPLPDALKARLEAIIAEAG